ncbi:hypothetical protein HMPREF1989_01400 [Porphyromonas gingivalis F0566]|nr:hypothetical protein HMPREF1989_01400 [Porphyromonas gingivalis F0566]
MQTEKVANQKATFLLLTVLMSVTHKSWRSFRGIRIYNDTEKSVN